MHDFEVVVRESLGGGPQAETWTRGVSVSSLFIATVGSQQGDLDKVVIVDRSTAVSPRERQERLISRRQFADSVFQLTPLLCSWARKASPVGDSPVHIGLLMRNRAEYLQAMYACFCSNLYFVPLDPEAPPSRLMQRCDGARISAVLFCKEDLRIANKLLYETTSVSTLMCLDSHDIFSVREVFSDSPLASTDLWDAVAERAVEAGTVGDVEHGISAADIVAGGWVSSFTGQPLTVVQMAEYASNVESKFLGLTSAAMRLAQKPRVLEIGCSSGITLRRLVKHSSSYVATDFSGRMVDFVKRQVVLRLEPREAAKLTVLHAEAIDVRERLAPASRFDVIVINSVVHCFPGHNYLRDVLVQCRALLTDSGKLFLGDIMDSDQKDFLIQDLRDYAAKASPQERHKTKLQWDTELFLSKAFLKHISEELGFAVDFSGKLAEASDDTLNELLGYRFDAVLSAAPASKVASQPWKRLMDLSALWRRDQCFGLRVSPQDPAYVLFTSGTTGAPMGAEISQAAIASYVHKAKGLYGFASTSVMPVYSAVTFDFSFTALLLPLLSDGAVEILPRFEDSLQSGMLRSRSSITHLKITPSHLRLLLDDAPSLPLPARTFVVGGEALSSRLLKDLADLQQVGVLFDEFGPTELTIGCFWKKHDLTEVAASHALPTVTIGKPFPGCEVSIDEHTGELLACGVCLFNGYVDACAGRTWKPERYFQTVCREDGFATTMYKTGDRVERHSNGDYVYLGRLAGASWAKISGARVDLKEIEACLREGPHGVRECVVACQTDEDTDEPYLLAFVLAASSSGAAGSPEPAALREYLSQRLEAHAVPRAVVPVAGLPTTRHGKVDTEELVRVYLADARRHSLQAAAAGLAPERRPLAAPPVAGSLLDIVSRIWEQVLECGRVLDREDDFFQLGGQSMEAMRVMRLLQQHGVAGATVSGLYRCRTLGSFSTLLRLADAASSTPRPAAASNMRAPEPPASTVPVHRSAAPPIVHDFFASSPVNANRFAMCSLVRVRRSEPLSRQIIRAAFSGSFWPRFGDVLSTRFEYDTASGSVTMTSGDQRVGEESALSFHTFAGIPSAGECGIHTTKAFHCLVEEVEGSLDIAVGKVFRLCIIERDSEQYLFFVSHHLVVDLVTYDILTESLCCALREATQCARPAPALAAFSASLARPPWFQYCAGLRELTMCGYFSDDKRYWDGVLERSTLHCTNVPGNGASVGSFTMASAGFLMRDCTSISESVLTEAVARLNAPHPSDERPFTEYHLILAALGAAVQIWKRDASPTSILLEGHGREELTTELPSSSDSSELDALARACSDAVHAGAGWFTSRFPFILDGCLTDVKAVRDALAAVPRSGLSFGWLKYYGGLSMEGNCSSSTAAIEQYSAQNFQIMYMHSGKTGLKDALEVTSDDVLNLESVTWQQILTSSKNQLKDGFHHRAADEKREFELEILTRVDDFNSTGAEASLKIVCLYDIRRRSEMDVQAFFHTFEAALKHLTAVEGEPPRNEAGVAGSVSTVQLRCGASFEIPGMADAFEGMGIPRAVVLPPISASTFLESVSRVVSAEPDNFGIVVLAVRAEGKDTVLTVWKACEGQLCEASVSEVRSWVVVLDLSSMGTAAAADAEVSVSVSSDGRRALKVVPLGTDFKPFFDADAELSFNMPLTRAGCAMVMSRIQREAKAVLPGTALAVLSGAELAAEPLIKLIVLDCDHTLWEGEAANGVAALTVLPDQRKLQAWAAARRREGTLLALSSKNVEGDVEAVFRSCDLRLDLAWEDFVCTRVNWQAKSGNIKSVLSSLNLGAESCLFIDDNRLECEEVLAGVPGIHMMHFAENACFGGFQFGSGAAASDEALRRHDLYAAESKRQQERDQAASSQAAVDAFLASSDLRMTVLNLKVGDLVHESEGSRPAFQRIRGRVVELLERTNQFKLNSDVRSLDGLAPDLGVRVVGLADKFGRYGLISVAIFSVQLQQLLQWVLSCRALGRRIDSAIFDGFAGMRLSFQPTGRNEALRVFLNEAFDCDLPVDVASGLEVPVRDFANPNGPVKVEHCSSVDDFLAEVYGVELAVVADPKLDLRSTVQKAWCAQLGSEATATGDEDFFVAGGDSYKAAFLISQLKRDLRIADLGLRALLTHRTFGAFFQAVCELAARRGEVEVRPEASGRWVDADVLLPLSKAQAGLYLIQQLDPQSSAYLETLGFRVDSREHAVHVYTELLKRFPLLRARIEGNDRGEPRLRVRAGSLREGDLRVVDVGCAAVRACQDMGELRVADVGGAAARSRQGSLEARAASGFREMPMFGTDCGAADADAGCGLQRLLVYSDSTAAGQSTSLVAALQVHHLLADADTVRQLGKMLRELLPLGLAAPRSCPEIDLEAGLQLACQFVAAEEQYLLSPQYNEDADHWKRQPIAAASGTADFHPMLATQPTAAAAQLGGVAVCRSLAKLPADLDLDGCARRLGVTRFHVLLAAHVKLQMLYQNRRRTVTLVPISLRTLLNIGTTSASDGIGMYVTTLRFFMDASSATAESNDWIRHVADAFRESHLHGAFPFADQAAPEEPSDAKALPRTVMPGWMFNVVEVEDGPVGCGAVFRVQPAHAKTELCVDCFVESEGGSVTIQLEHIVGMLSELAAQRLLATFVNLLWDLVRGRSAPSSLCDAEVKLQMRLLGHDRDRALLSTEADPDFRKPYLFEEAVARVWHYAATCSGEFQPAVVCADRELSYRSLVYLSEHLSADLSQAMQVVRPATSNGPVMLLLGRDESAIVCVLACWRAGTSFLPVTAATCQERIRAAAQHCCSVAVTNLEASSSLLAGLNFQVLHYGLGEARHGLATASSLVFWPSVIMPTTQAAYSIMTSGSTGLPKLITIAKSSLLKMSHAWKDLYELGSFEVALLQWAAMSFDVFVGDVMRALVCPLLAELSPGQPQRAGRLILCEEDRRIDVLFVGAGLIEKHRVSIAEFTPQFAILLLYSNAAAMFNSMKVFIVGSDVVYEPQFQMLWDKLNGTKCGTNARLFNSYGLSEATVDSTCFEAQVDAASGSLMLGTRSGTVPIGKPLPGGCVSLFVLSESLDQPVPIGTVGMLCIAGPTVAVKGCDAMLHNFVFREATMRVLITGDRARLLEDGNIELLGRQAGSNSSIVKKNGLRVSPSEVVHQLLLAAESTGTIAGAHCEVFSERSSGKCDEMCLFVVLAKGASSGLTKERVHHLLRDRVPAYSLPDVVHMLDTLPLTAHGKLDVRALLHVHRSSQSTRLYAAHLEPMSSTGLDLLQSDLMSLWREVVGPSHDLSLEHAFGDMGGSSLKYIQYHVVVRQRLLTPTWQHEERYGTLLNQDFQVVHLFTCSSVSSLAAFLLGPSRGTTSIRLPTADLHKSLPTVVCSAEGAEQVPSVFLDASGLRFLPTTAWAASDVVILGVSLRLPGGLGAAHDSTSMRDVHQLLAGECPADLVQPFPECRRMQDVLMCTKDSSTKEFLESLELYEGCFLRDVSSFDFEFFGMTRADAGATCPEQRLFMTVAAEALADSLEDADFKRAVRGTDTAVFVAHSEAASEYKRMLNVDLLNPAVLPGAMASFLGRRVAYAFDLQGAVETVDTTCSSLLVVVHKARQSLRDQDDAPESALVGGVNLVIYPGREGVHAKAMGIMAPDFRCRAFDADAEGTSVGEGAVCLVLKAAGTLCAPERERLYGAVKGSAVNGSGRSNGLVAPRSEAQAQVIRKAMKAAREAPSCVSYVETHGTGTKLGDALELDGLLQAFSERDPRADPLLLGTSKPNFGHLDSAAGGVALVKLLCMLRGGRMYKALHCITPHESLKANGHKLQVVQVEVSLPARAMLGVSAFGLSGTNAHALLHGGDILPMPWSSDTRAPAALLWSNCRCWAPVNAELAGRAQPHTVAPPAMQTAPVAPHAVSVLFDGLRHVNEAAASLVLKSVPPGLRQAQLDFCNSLILDFLSKTAVGNAWLGKDVYEDTLQIGTTIGRAELFSRTWIHDMPQYRKLFFVMLRSLEEGGFLETVAAEEQWDGRDAWNPLPGCVRILRKRFENDTPGAEHCGSFEWEPCAASSGACLADEVLLTASGKAPPKFNRNDPVSLLIHGVSCFPGWESTFRLTYHSVSQFEPVLLGDQPPLSLIYPQGQLDFISDNFPKLGDPLGDVYFAGYMTGIADCMAAEVAVRRCSGDRTPVRVLEVGAGMGHITNKLVPRLKDLVINEWRSNARNGQGAPLTYTFTDIGLEFVRNASEKLFDQDHDFMSFGVYDITKNPELQGISGQFDFILAYNVVHTTQSIGKCFESLGRSLSTSSGESALFLIESALNETWATLSWGVLPGWWLFEDYDVRAHDPMLSVSEWEAVLSLWFREVQSWPSPDMLVERADSVEKSLFVARRPMHPGEASEPSTRSTDGSTVETRAMVQHFQAKDLDSPSAPEGSPAGLALAEADGGFVEATVLVPLQDAPIVKMRAVWKKVLGAHSDIADHVQFADVGGESLSAISLIQRVKDAFPGTCLEIADVWMHPTIAQLTAFVGTERLVWLFGPQGFDYTSLLEGNLEAKPELNAIYQECEAMTKDILAKNEGLGDVASAMALARQFSAQYALGMYFLDEGTVPDVILGHSLGEYVAWAVAGLLDLETALTLVMKRAELVEAEIPAAHAMLAVRASKAEVDVVLRQCEQDDVYVAVTNSDVSTVLACGSKETAEAMVAVLAAGGISSKHVADVEYGYHSPLVQPAAKRFRSLLNDLNVTEKVQGAVHHSTTGSGGSVPQLFSAVNAGVVRPRVVNVAQHFVAHLTGEVRFQHTVQALLKKPKKSCFVEFCPKPYLINFVRGGASRTENTFMSLHGDPTDVLDKAFERQLACKTFAGSARREAR